jgi:hypothetical protein
MRVDSVSWLSTRQRQSDLRDQIHRESLIYTAIRADCRLVSSPTIPNRTRFAPSRWKFGLLLSRNVYTPREFMPGGLFVAVTLVAICPQQA